MQGRLESNIMWITWLPAQDKVLQLPPYHSNEKHVHRNNVNPKFSESALNIIREDTQNITPKHWKHCIRLTTSIEHEYILYY